MVYTLILVMVVLAAVGCCHGQVTETTGDVPMVHDYLKSNGLDGKVTLIEFGIIGCTRSEQGLVKMIAMDRDHTIPNLAFARVEPTQDAKTIEAYYEKKAPGFAVIRDPNTAMAQAFKATVYPTFVIVDKFGNVRYRGKYPGDKLATWSKALNAETRDLGPDAPMLGVVPLNVPKLLKQTTLSDLAGKKTNLAKCAGKSGLLIMFVNTRCPYSAIAIGESAAVATTLAKNGIKTVMINVADPAATVKQFYAKKKTPLLLWDATADTAVAWDVQAVPTTIFISSGAVHYRGGGEWDPLARAIEKTLSLADGSIIFSTKGTGFG